MKNNTNRDNGQKGHNPQESQMNKNSHESKNANSRNNDNVQRSPEHTKEQNTPGMNADYYDAGFEKNTKQEEDLQEGWNVSPEETEDDSYDGEIKI